MFKAKDCPDCGSAPVFHGFVKWGVAFDAQSEKLLSRPEKWLRKIFSPLSPLATKVVVAIIELLSTIKVLKKNFEPDKLTPERTRVFWLEAKKRNLKMWEYRLFGQVLDTYGATINGKKIIFKSLPLPKSDRWKSTSIDWMDDKGKMREIFEAANLPVPKGAVAGNLEEGFALFEKLDKPVITKPNLGSRSRHTTIHITHPEEFRTAYEKAQRLSPWVIVEEELAGAVHRVTLVGGKVVAVCRRDPAAVVGDGVHSVAELALMENAKPLRQGPIFHHVPTKDNSSEVTEKELARQKLTWESTPAGGTVVTLGNITSRGVGGSIIDVTDNLHHDNVKIFEEMGALLGDPLVGIDFIVKDMSRSWREQLHSGAIECNSMPFIELHHYPLEGKPRNVAGALLDLVLAG